MYVSLKEALYQLKTLCEAHEQVNSYYHGDSIVELYKSNEITHATILTVAQSATYEPNFINVTIQLACIDKVLKGNENAHEIESNTLAIIGDLINYINIDDAWRYAKVIVTPSATKLVDRTQDVASGWIASIQFRLVKDNGKCDLPIDGVTPIPSCLPVTITDSDGVTIYEVASGASFVCTPNVTSGIAYKNIITTGQLTSYRTGDEAWHVANGSYDTTSPASPVSYAELDQSAANPFLTLVSNNAFGNKNRLTDDLGTQIYASGLVICHLTGWMWYNVLQGTNSWNAAIDNAAASTQGGYSDWMIPLFEQYLTIANAEMNETLNYAPFNISGVRRFWTPTTNLTDTLRKYVFMTVISATQAYNMTREARTGAHNYLLVRKHY